VPLCLFLFNPMTLDVTAWWAVGVNLLPFQAQAQAQAQTGGGDPALLDRLPHGAIDPTHLPEEDQRELYDAFHLQVRYDRAKHRVTPRATIYAPSREQRRRTTSHRRQQRPRPPCGDRANGERSRHR